MKAVPHWQVLGFRKSNGYEIHVKKLLNFGTTLPTSLLGWLPRRLLKKERQFRYWVLVTHARKAIGARCTGGALRAQD